MEKMEATLREWLAMDPEMVTFAKIKIDPGLQPRAEGLVTFRDRGRMEEFSDEHVTRMRGVLEARKEAQLEPLLLADVDGTTYVVDGHHRLRAYKLAKRKSVPARVRELSYKDAVLLSKLVNLGGAKLPLHNEQARDAAWQFLAEVTNRGALKLPQGESTRTLAARFGISHDTVASMLRRLPTVEWTEYGPMQRDPGTDWPRWRFVKENCKWIGDEIPEDARVQRRAEQVAKQLFKLLNRVGPEALHRGFLLFLQEGHEGTDLVDRFEASRQMMAELAIEEAEDL